MSLGKHQAMLYQQEMFRKDCQRRKLTTWQERKKYSQNDKLWSKLIEWQPFPGKQPNSADYYEFPQFIVVRNSQKDSKEKF